MAGRPIKQRTTKSYLRDIESITRLRTAISLDGSIPPEKRKKAVRAADAFLEKLTEIAAA